jgi:hypothetical protein
MLQTTIPCDEHRKFSSGELAGTILVEYTFSYRAPYLMYYFAARVSQKSCRRLTSTIRSSVVLDQRLSLVPIRPFWFQGWVVSWAHNIIAVYGSRALITICDQSPLTLVMSIMMVLL